MDHGEIAERRLTEIAAVSATRDGVTRLPWTGEHRAAIDLITSWMKDAGLSVRLDAAGTLVGASPNLEGKPVLLIGSHQDSVPTGGAYDGIMGVALGCLAAKSLRSRLQDLPFALEILAFADEEGVRFPTALIGPRALAGTLDPAALDMVDRNGVSMREAMERFGVETSTTFDIARAPENTLGYFEVHIEQGPVLEERNLPVAAVSAICGISRFEVVVTGETGHAGTVPMTGRRDALVAASRIVATVSDAAGAERDVRATVGQMAVSPGAVNAIPAEVRFPLEVRAPEDAERERFEEGIVARAGDICQAAGCDLAVRRTYSQPAAVCDRALTQALENAIQLAGLEPLCIPSGATHDASAMADLCPISMLFVRCRGGISHRPDEFASAADMGVAIEVLVTAIEALGRTSSRLAED